MQMASGAQDMQTTEGLDPEEGVFGPRSLAAALHARRDEYIRRRTIKVKIGTWNVAGCPGTDKDLASWFSEDAAPISNKLESLHISDNSQHDDDETPPPPTKGHDIGLYVLGLQEVVDLNMTRDYMNRTMYSESGPLEKWKAAVEAVLPLGYELVAVDQMVGLLMFIYASPEVFKTISNVSTKQVGTGLLGYFGNKGAIATRIILGDTTRLVFINSHLASGAGSSFLDRRYWDVGQIVAKTQFDPLINTGVNTSPSIREGEKIGDEDFAFWFGDLNFRLEGLPGNDIRRILTLHMRGEYDVNNPSTSSAFEDEGVIVTTKTSESDDDDDTTTTTTATTTTSSLHSREHSFDTETSLPDPDEFPIDPSQDPASLQATIDSLLPHDQLKRSMASRKVFHDGWREGAVRFLPTYKYDVGSVFLFDSSEKQRAPSWCDRILFRTRLDLETHEKKISEETEAKKKDNEMKSRGLGQDDDILFSYDPDSDGDENNDGVAPAAANVYDEYDENEDPEPQDVVTAEQSVDRISLDLYTSNQRITSSDHKPIVSLFTLDYDCVVPELKAQVYAEVARELDRAENERRPGITIVSDGEDGAVDLGDLGFLERISTSLTVANTGSVPATVSFVEKPVVDDSESDASVSWIKTTLQHGDDSEEKTNNKEVILKPGETAIATIDAQVSTIPFLRALNDGHQSLDDVLVLRVEGGRDHFLPVRANWQPTCFGRSIDELIRVPEGGIRKFLIGNDIKGATPYNYDVHCSAPRELFRLTEAIQTLSERCIADAAMLDEMELPGEPGWPFDATTWAADTAEKETLKANIISALDCDKSLMEALPVELSSMHRLELLASVLLLFLSSLTDGLIPSQLAARLATSVPNLGNIPESQWADMKVQILDSMSSAPNHSIAFVFLATTMSRVAADLLPVTKAGQGIQRRLSFKKATEDAEAIRKRRARDKRYAEVLAPVIFRDKTAADKERSIFELFLHKDVEG